MSIHRIALANLRFPATAEESIEAARAAVGQAASEGAERAEGKQVPLL